MKKVIAVIPAYNEQDRIGEVIERTKCFVDDIIVVDDGSTDNTAMISQNKGAYLIKLDWNRGAGFATRTGCDCAVEKGAEIIVTIDADGQHSPCDIPKLLAPLFSDEVDIVFGIRPKDKRMPFVKRIGGVFLSLLAKILFRSDIKDVLTGFHAFRRDCYNLLRWDCAGYGMVSEIAYKATKYKLKCTQVVVETIYNDKKNGMRIIHGIESILLMLKWKMGKH